MSFSIAMVAACPFPAKFGTPAAIREMSEELARRGHSIRVVTYPLSHAIPITGVEIDRVAHVGSNREISVGPSFQRLAFDALMVFKLFQVVRRHKVDIIHAHNYEGALIGSFVGKITGIPVIYNAINTMIGELASYNCIRPRALAIGLARVLDYVVPRLADMIIADTEELRSFLLSKGIDPERVVTINSGVRPEMFDGADGSRVRDRFAADGGPLVVYTGTFDDVQGIDHLLAAFKTVHDRKPNASLGPWLVRLIRLTRRSTRKWLSILGSPHGLQSHPAASKSCLGFSQQPMWPLSPGRTRPVSQQNS